MPAIVSILGGYDIVPRYSKQCISDCRRPLFSCRFELIAEAHDLNILPVSFVLPSSITKTLEPGPADDSRSPESSPAAEPRVLSALPRSSQGVQTSSPTIGRNNSLRKNQLCGQRAQPPEARGSTLPLHVLPPLSEFFPSLKSTA